MEFIKLKNVCPVLDLFLKDKSDKLHSKRKYLQITCLKRINIKNIQRTLKTQQLKNNPIRKWAKNMNRPFPKNISIDVKLEHEEMLSTTKRDQHHS